MIKTKKDLCFMMKYKLGIKRTARDIKILEYDKNGFICSFSVKLGSNFIGFTYFDRSVGYLMNNKLTFRLNEM